MRFWKRARRARQDRRVAAVVDIESLIRRFLLDGRMAEAQQLGTLLGLAPLDPDIEAEELSESDDRAQRVAHLVPILDLLSSVMAGSVVEYLRTISSSLEDLDDESASQIADLMQKTCLSTTVGAISQLEDLGLVKYSHLR